MSLTAPAPPPDAPSHPPPALAPARERIAAIDTLRGVALLGILLVNVLDFGLPVQATDNPAVYGGANGADLATWYAVSVLFAGKMRALFSMLFGAGVVLFTLGRGRHGDEVADPYYRRTLWLAVFGFLHGKFLWEGDILLIYGLVGVVLFLLRRLRPSVLLLLGVAVLAVGTLPAVGGARETKELRAKAEQAEAARDRGEKLTEEQKEAIEEWEEKEKESRPSEEEIDKEIQHRRGGYWDNYRHRAHVLEDTSSHELAEELLDAAGAMLLGMGLFKLGVFSAVRSRRFYVGLLLLGYGLGLPLAAYVAWRRAAAGFEPGQTEMLEALAYHPSRMSVAVGHAAVVMLLVRSGWLAGLLRLLAAVGRMALTNYLMQTVLCTTFFYGYGLGWFAHLSRAQLLWVVAAVWALELAWSAPWLRFFQFGPMEWLWRWLTYLRRPPLLRGPLARRASEGFLPRKGSCARPRWRELGARVVTMPALATGFGPLSMEEFAEALGQATARDWAPIEVLKVVLREQEDAETVRAGLARSRDRFTGKDRAAGSSP